MSDVPVKEPVKKKAQTQKKDKSFFMVGKRKRAVAKASFKKGSGIIRINSRPLELAMDRLSVMRIAEAVEMAGDVAKAYDVDITVKGGGCSGQAEACRVALAKGLAEVGGDVLKKAYMAYDRNMLVYDPRRIEPSKPPRSSKGARRHKQRSKR